MTHGGACGSKNVGTSNRKEGEIPSRRKIKVSWATVFAPGLVGPKEMTKVVFDGQLVNIPALLLLFEGRTECSIQSSLLDLSLLVRVASRKIRKLT